MQSEPRFARPLPANKWTLTFIFVQKHVFMQNDAGLSLTLFRTTVHHLESKPSRESSVPPKSSSLSHNSPRFRRYQNSGIQDLKGLEFQVFCTAPKRCQVCTIIEMPVRATVRDEGTPASLKLTDPDYPAPALMCTVRRYGAVEYIRKEVQDERSTGI